MRNQAAFSNPSGRVVVNTHLLRDNVSRSKASPAEVEMLHCLNTDSISRRSGGFDCNSLHAPSASSRPAEEATVLMHRFRAKPTASKGLGALCAGVKPRILLHRSQLEEAEVARGLSWTWQGSG